MAEDTGNKTETATPRRRQEAWDSGNMARSQDLTAAVLLLAGLLIVHLTGASMVARLAGMMRELLGKNYWATRTELIDNSTRLALQAAIGSLLPIFLTMAIMALAVNLLQVGFRFTPKPLQPNLAKLNPIAGFKRLMKGQNWFQLGMNVCKIIVVGSVAFERFRHHMPAMLGLMGVDFPRNIMMAGDMVFDLGLRVAIVLLILAILDWIYHRWKFERDIRMTKQEVKDEAKMMEGDMEAKARRRGLARKMILQRIHADVPRADVVVTNPTELAIALRYDPENMTAPRVVAKGAGYLAMTIRQVAVQHGVPIVERKPLAQALYKTVEVGQEVPPHFYQAIAEILAYVYELSGKKTRVRQAATVGV